MKNVVHFLISMLLMPLAVEASNFNEEQMKAFNQLTESQQQQLLDRLNSGEELDGTVTPSQSTRNVWEPEPLGRVGNVPEVGDPVAARSAPADTDLVEKASAQKDSNTLKPYGYDLFEGNVNAFTSNPGLPVPDDYQLGAGDSLRLFLYGKENSEYALTIEKDGTIFLPKLGPLQIAGATFLEAKQLIQSRLASRRIGLESAIVMGKLRSIRVFVLGEVAHPGSYIVSSLSTMTNALFASGGVTPIGSLRNVSLKRAGKTVSQLDLYDLMMRGDTSDDSLLLASDVIFVPPIGATVKIRGGVKRPAQYELKHEASFGSVINLAGGLSVDAYATHSQVKRSTRDGERELLDLDLSKPDLLQRRVKAGDSIYIGERLNLEEDSIELIGRFKRPGERGWVAGLTLGQLVSKRHMLEVDADLSAILVIGRSVGADVPSARLISLPPNFQTMPQHEFSLEAGDRVIVFGKGDDRAALVEPIVKEFERDANGGAPAKVLEVEGYFKSVGQFPLVENMTPADAIRMVGGLKPFAGKENLEVVRRYVQADGVINYKVLPIGSSQIATFKLEPGDRVVARRIPGHIETRTVEVTGEVRYPGTYAISSNETFADVVRRAGGVLDNADLSAAVFTRKSLRELESERLTELKSSLEAEIALSNAEETTEAKRISSKDANKLLSSLQSQKPLGRMVVDAPAALRGDPDMAVVLEAGDTIHFPRQKSSVTVVGEVQYPTSHLYERSFNVDDYIERSGGLNGNADDRRIYIVRANGSVIVPKKRAWFAWRSGKLSAGDTIVVPLDADRIKPLDLWTNVSQIFYQMALGAAAVASF